MKHLKISAVVVSLAALVNTGCENNFDPNLFGTLNPENYPTTESEYTSYMMTCYLPFTTVWTYDMGSGGVQHGWYIPSGGVHRMFDATADYQANATLRGEDWAYFTRGQFGQCVYYRRGSVDDGSNLNHFPKTAQITRYTEIIGTLEAAAPENLSEEKKNSLLGEARLCRGMMMYYLMHCYGPVPVILDPTKVTDSEALSHTVRPTLDEMCQYIYDDFDFAAKHAPETAPDQGRFTRDFGRFFLMRHCLNEGSHMPGWYERGLEAYNELNTGKYSLFTAGSNSYAEVFKNANKFNSEIIAAISCSETADGNPKHGNFWPFLMWTLPSDLVAEDPFPMGGGWFQFFAIAPDYYDKFEANDKRRETILTSYRAKDGSTVNRTHLGTRLVGFIINKWPQETLTQFQGQDVPLARWADALLMYAELEARSKGTVSSQALEAVNSVRRRAGLDNLSGAAASDKDAFLDAILTERGHELMYEGCRKIDLIRFNRYAQEFYKVKSLIPDHQYMPLPNYAVQSASEYGHDLTQEYSRPGWNEDVAKARPSSL